MADMKHEDDLREHNPKPVSMKQLEDSLHTSTVIATQVVGIMNADSKVYFDAPEDFLKMLDHMRDIVVNQLPTWNTRQLIFLICDTGVQLIVENPNVPHEPDEQVTKQ